MRTWIKKIYRKVVTQRIEENRYQAWIKACTPDKNTASEQQKEGFEEAPLFSIVVPLYYTPEKYLKELIESVWMQTYFNWELILSDGSGENSPLKECLAEYKSDDRITVLESNQPMDISENTNCAIRAAKGEYIVFADHDDVLAPHALYECAKIICEQNAPDLIYTDEDKITMNGKRYFQPHFKPDFDLYLLRSMNYFCHLVVVKKSLQEQVGMLNAEYNGAQDYDFVLRCVENAKNIYHIPKVLYHWRAHPGSIAGNGQSKDYAFEAGRQALLAHYERCSVEAKVEKGELFGVFHTTYICKEEPLVSIIVSEKKKNMSVIEKTGYVNYEIIEEGEIEHAKGEYLLLLGKDIVEATPSWLVKMLEYALQPKVGIVGVHLYEPNNKQKNAGVIIGGENILNNVAYGSDIDDVGYFGRYICTQEYSAVDGTCMMIRKSCFEDVGGFEQQMNGELKYADLCLKTQEAGYLVVYNPMIKMKCKKSIVKYDEKEKLYFKEKWKRFLEEGDPHYNKNLSLQQQLFTLK